LNWTSTFWVRALARTRSTPASRPSRLSSWSGSPPGTCARTRPGSEWMTRGASAVGSSSSAEPVKRYLFDAPEEARDPARVVRLEPERELRLERVVPDDERPPREEAPLPLERLGWRVPEDPPDEDRVVVVAAAPSLAPRTAPRPAASATSPAFIRPARPYTAPRRKSSLARGETAAAVAAAIAPASRSM